MIATVLNCPVEPRSTRGSTVRSSSPRAFDPVDDRSPRALLARCPRASVVLSQLGLQDPVFSGQILIPAGAAPGPPYGKLFARLGSFDHLVFTAGKTLQLGSLATYRWCPAGITARLFYRFNILATRHVRVGGAAERTIRCGAHTRPPPPMRAWMRTRSENC